MEPKGQWRGRHTFREGGGRWRGQGAFREGGGRWRNPANFVEGGGRWLPENKGATGPWTWGVGGPFTGRSRADVLASRGGPTGGGNPSPSQPFPTPLPLPGSPTSPSQPFPTPLPLPGSPTSPAARGGVPPNQGSPIPPILRGGLTGSWEDPNYDRVPPGGFPSPGSYGGMTGGNNDFQMWLQQLMSRWYGGA